MENKNIVNKIQEDSRNARFQLWTNSHHPSVPKNALMWIVRGFGAGWFMYEEDKWYQHWFFLPPELPNWIDGIIEKMCKLVGIQYFNNNEKEKGVLQAVIDDLVKTKDLLKAEKKNKK